MKCTRIDKNHELLHKPVLDRLCICIFVFEAALVVVEEVVELAALAADLGLD